MKKEEKYEYKMLLTAEEANNLCYARMQKANSKKWYRDIGIMLAVVITGTLLGASEAALGWRILGYVMMVGGLLVYLYLQRPSQYRETVRAMMEAAKADNSQIPERQKSR